MASGETVNKTHAEYKQRELNERCEKTGKVLGKHVINMYSTRISRVVEIRDIKKLQQNIENNPIIKDQMANLGCLLVCTFGSFLALVLVTAHRVNNLDLSHERGYENEVIKVIKKGFFFLSAHRIQKRFDEKESRKVTLSVQRLIVASFKFNCKNIRAVHVPGPRQCLVDIDVSREIWYVDDNNDRRAIKRDVPQKYLMQLQDVKTIVKRHAQSDVPQDDANLLKEPSLCCFLFRCKIPEVESFME